MEQTRILTVTEINASIRGLLEGAFPFVSVAGEISNLRRPFSGHIYFTLKDEQSRLKAVLFKMQQRYLDELPADGRKVICRGRISVYEPRGDYQIIVDAIDFHGTGILHLRFEELKKKLDAEGLFDPGTKKPLPFLPRHLTLVTSPDGAAVYDFLKVARTRCPGTGIAVFPVSVQGDRAGAEISEAVAVINKQMQTDLIVLCRGGGSLEDLWAFNEEVVARAIAASDIPVVSAVGHEVDFTISDFVADLRAPTPSAAAEIILPDTGQLRDRVRQLEQRMIRTMTGSLDRRAQRLSGKTQALLSWSRKFDVLLLRMDQAGQALERAVRRMVAEKEKRTTRLEQQLLTHSPAARLQLGQGQVNELERRLVTAVQNRISGAGNAFKRAASLLDAVSPLSTLARGYAIVRKEKDEVITDFQDVNVNDQIEVTLHHGYLECRIEKTGRSRFQKMAGEQENG